MDLEVALAQSLDVHTCFQYSCVEAYYLTRAMFIRYPVDSGGLRKSVGEQWDLIIACASAGSLSCAHGDCEYVHQ